MKNNTKRICAGLLALLLLVLSAFNSFGGQTSFVLAQTTTDAYQARDAFFSMTDTNVNRMTSEHFQIIWGNEDSTGTVTEEFVAGNLENLESIWNFYVNVLEMEEPNISENTSITGTYKTNLYISNTGLGDVVEDDWAYMSVDADSFGYMVLMPGAMRVDAPSWVVPHELAHVFTYHQGGVVQEGWYEATANWFRDQYLGSEYYAYGDTIYGPASDFFAPYILNSDYYFPHLKNWYDAWPILLYISENPDEIDGLGMELIHKILENTQEDDTVFTTIERLSNVSIKTILGGMTRRLVTMDFSRQDCYLEYLNTLLAEDSANEAKIYSSLTSTDDGYLTISSDRAPMQGGYNIIPLDADLSAQQLNVEFVNTSSASDADFRVSIVTKTADNTTRYSDMFCSGTGSIALQGDETAAYLVVCATPDNMEDLEIYDETAVSTRYTYKIKVSTSQTSTEEEETPSQEPTTSSEYVQNFTTNGLESSYYTIHGNLSSSKGTRMYEDLTLTTCLKMESSTAITFTADTSGTLTLVFTDASKGSVKIDGKKYTYSDGILSLSLLAGTHTIAKGTSANLYYLQFSED